MKTLLFPLLIISALFSSENYELELYEKIFPLLFQKKSLHIYTQDSEYAQLLKESTLLKTSDKCKDADLLLGKKLDNIANECNDKPIFATSYRSFAHTENSFGAFYWAKGRPQLHFKLKVIEKYHLYLPQNLLRYAK